MSTNLTTTSFLLLYTSLIITTFLNLISGQGGPPSPGYYPSSNFPLLEFDQGFRNLWGPQHQSIDQDDGSLTIWLDTSSGSGFKSIRPYTSGYFATSVKLQPGYTAGVITCFYVRSSPNVLRYITVGIIALLLIVVCPGVDSQLSNNEDFPGNHDEVDIEFLGTTLDKPYTLQTNVYVRGSGDGNIIGREMRFHLWFDPTQDFHQYAILWNPIEIIFLVDDVPIRRYPRKSDTTFPSRPMWVYGSIWDASSWATENGKYKADYQYEPFVGQYKDFAIGGCASDSPSSCRAPSASKSKSGGLSKRQSSAMDWVQGNYIVYDYCKDPARDHTLTPEC